jgi:hypothetical protein
MKERNPLISAALGIIPGLGQVYTGKTLLGIIVFFFTAIIFFFTTILPFFSIWLDKFTLLSLGVLIWASGIFYAWYTEKRILSGEIQFSEPGKKEYLTFIAGIFVTCLIVICLIPLLAIMLSILLSHPVNAYTIPVTVQKNGTLITLYNSDIEPDQNVSEMVLCRSICGRTWYDTTVNGVEANQCWVNGPLCEVNGTSGKDHIVVKSTSMHISGASDKGSFETYV